MVYCTVVIMGKRRFTEDGWKNDPWFRSLVNALHSCETEEEMAGLLRDIGSLAELQAWSERMEVAKQLSQGLTYREVAKNTGASTTTVTRVAKSIENGEGGYIKFLKTHRHHRARKQFETPEELKKEKSEEMLRKYL